MADSELRVVRVAKDLVKAALQVRYSYLASRFGQRIKGLVANGNDAAPESNPLSEYFDSVTKGPGIWKWRHYFDIYHRHCQQFIGREVHIVEVGIYSGGSLGMWREYFGPDAHIYGIDIEPACRTYARDGIRIFIGDQGDRAFWREFRREVPRVDIFIDDGGHTPEQQRITLEEMLPHLQPGGVYVCEDIHGHVNPFGGFAAGLINDLNEWGPNGMNGQDGTTHTNPLQRTVRGIHAYPFCLVIEKNPADVSRLVSSKHGTEWQPIKF